MSYFQQRGKDFGTLGLSDDTPSVAPLTVRFYSGVGWASYQSPVSDQMIRALQRELRRGGWTTLPEDGIVHTTTLTIARSFAGDNIKDGNPLVATAARALTALSSTSKLLATYANVAYGYAKTINDAHGKAFQPLPPIRSTPPTPVAPAPAEPPPPFPPPGGDAWYKTPLGIAALAVGAGLVYVNTRKGRRRGSR